MFLKQVYNISFYFSLPVFNIYKRIESLIHISVPNGTIEIIFSTVLEIVCDSVRAYIPTIFNVMRSIMVILIMKYITFL